MEKKKHLKEIPKNNSVREVEKADKIKKAKIELFENTTGANAFCKLSGPVIWTEFNQCIRKLRSESFSFDPMLLS